MALPGMMGGGMAVRSNLSPKSGVPWATDDQWGALKAEATRLSLEMERKANGPGPARRTPASGGGGDGRKKSQADAKPGDLAKASVFWSPPKGVSEKRFDSNPYEGVLGPPLVESSVAQRAHARVDVSKLIRTPKEVWKSGKQPTQTFAGTLPGTHSEIRASQRTPSYMRGLPLRARTAAGEESEEEAGATRPDSVEEFRSTLYTPEAGSVRARSAMSVDSAGGRSTPSLGLPPVDGAMEGELIRLKAELSRLRAMAAEREGELERLRGAQGKANVDQEMVEGVDVLLEDFRARAEARTEMQEGRLEGVVRQREALLEVERRLKLVNKGLTHRLHQTKEELRVYVSDIKDMTAMYQEVHAARDLAAKEVRQLRDQMGEDAQQRQVDLTRRQATVQRSLRDTNELGERVKQNQERRDREEAEREAEKELAQIRAHDNGTTVLDELKQIWERKAEGREGQVAKALKKIYARANTLSADGALGYLGECMKEHARLVDENEGLETRLDSLRRQSLHSAAAQRAVEGGDKEAKDLEALLGDIEVFGESSRQVAEAMSALILQYVDWAAALLARLVGHSDDEDFLRAALRLARRVPGEGASDEQLREWVSRTLPLIHNVVHEMLDASEAPGVRGAVGAAKAPLEEQKQLALPPPSGPGADKPVVKDEAVVRDLSGAQSLGVRRPEAGGGRMEALAPHSGFDLAAAVEVD